MSANHGAAYEEQAELKNLRDEADRSTAEAARTLAELTGRLAAASHPKTVARRLAVSARVTVLRAVRQGREKANLLHFAFPPKAGRTGQPQNEEGSLAGQRDARRLALIAIPVFLLLAAAAAVVIAREKLKTED
ncbi:MAG TPA: hypothetical protein VFO01_07155 [Trebonia sp.]|nr:hypothetical protein [Trebonia sp.]